MFLEILAHTPLYVYFLFAFLFWGGLKSRKNFLSSWKALLLMPSIMLAWSLYSNIVHYGLSSLFLWAISMALGISFGSLTTRKTRLRFDRQKKLIEVPGTWTPMFLSMTLFTLRFFLGTAYEMHPELKGSFFLIFIENVATLFSGTLFGRLIGYWEQYNASSSKTS